MNTERRRWAGLGCTLFLLYLAIRYWEPFVRILGLALSAAAPLLMGCAIAYVVNILMCFYEKRYFPRSRRAFLRTSARPVCMMGAFLTLILIVALVVRLVVPELVSCMEILFAEVPRAMQSLAEWLEQSALLSEKTAAALEAINWSAVLAKAFEFLKSGFSSTVNFAVGALSSMVSSAMRFFFSLIFVIYLLLGKEGLLSRVNRVLASYVRPAWNERLHAVFSVANACFHKYIVGQCAEAVILGALCALGMLIFRFPYAMMTGAVIGVTALIPVAGAWIGGAVAFVLILSASPMKAVLFIVYLLVLQQLENNLIYPRVVGTSLGLPGIWVLAAVTIGGGLFGVAGMLLGVPLTATAYQLLRGGVLKREAARREAAPPAGAGERPGTK